MVSTLRKPKRAGTRGLLGWGWQAGCKFRQSHSRQTALEVFARSKLQKDEKALQKGSQNSSHRIYSQPTMKKFATKKPPNSKSIQNQMHEQNHLFLDQPKPLSLTEPCLNIYTTTPPHREAQGNKATSNLASARTQQRLTRSHWLQSHRTCDSRFSVKEWRNCIEDMSSGEPSWPDSLDIHTWLCSRGRVYICVLET
jgi:hypothetical protein